MALLISKRVSKQIKPLFSGVRTHTDVPFLMSLEKLMEMGIEDKKAKLVITELNKTGIENSEIPSFVDSIGKTGLKQFVEAVDRAAINDNTPTVRVTFHAPKERHKFELDGKVGTDLCDLAETTELANYIECVCGGLMACSTCHVILEQSTFDKLPPATEAEQDMLDLAHGYCPTSRLGCQLVLGKELEGSTITIPEGVIDYFS